MNNLDCDCNAAELAAIVNNIASLMAKDKRVEEIEMLAVLFDLLSDTLFAIAVIEKKQQRVRDERERRCKEYCENRERDEPSCNNPP
ncbi:MAG: hypothetical protein FWG45_00440 [Oscillospiraceae bacterium]|nr:hypothetical protein [Oscillospiraceae bacterium]